MHNHITYLGICQEIIAMLMGDVPNQLRWCYLLLQFYNKGILGDGFIHIKTIELFERR